ncbi:MAG: ABC transporter permease [Nitrospirae bacterium]|jgi:ABC-2 type transport system permease protein|nr:ABC transporter permease [Nitrospirota bacterium]
MTVDILKEEEKAIDIPAPLIRDARAIYTLWLRDVIRLWRDKVRLVGSLIQPLLFLFILGGGLRGRLPNGLAGTSNYQQFIFPGILVMSILFTASFAGIAVVWDREVGFLKEVLVAPVSRTAVVFGKVLGGSTNSLLQALLLFGLFPYFKIHMTLLLFFESVLTMFAIGLAQTAMGIALSARMSSSQGFMVLLNFIILPLYFLSGAMFPLKGLPGWLSIAVRVDPVTYGVDLLRGILLGAHHFAFSVDMLALGSFGAGMVVLAAKLFNMESPGL